MDSWSRLAVYESSDLVRRLFEHQHGRSLSAEKACEIVSALAQSREYFSSADDAGLLVRPLLQYYGVLSLSRALCLLLSSNLREASLPQAHGLVSRDWGRILSNGPARAAEVCVLVANGTFLKLIEVTENMQPASVFTGPYPSNLQFFQRAPLPISSQHSFSLQDVLGRVPELRDLYERSFDKTASNYRGFVFTIDPKAITDIDLFPGKYGLPPEQQLRTELRIPEDVPIQETRNHNFVANELHLRYRLEHAQGYPSVLPRIEPGEHGYCSIVSPFPNGIQLTRIGRLFALAYFLGTLARYHPSTWLAIMQSRQRGDLMLPLVREAMQVVQLQFPVLALAELEA